MKIRTGVLDTRSQEAIARLGARREGVLRRDQRGGRHVRDTVVFCVLIDEWPAVKAGLRTGSRISVAP